MYCSAMKQMCRASLPVATVQTKTHEAFANVILEIQISLENLLHGLKLLAQYMFELGDAITLRDN